MLGRTQSFCFQSLAKSRQFRVLLIWIRILLSFCWVWLWQDLIIQTWISIVKCTQAHCSFHRDEFNWSKNRWSSWLDRPRHIVRLSKLFRKNRDGLPLKTFSPSPFRNNLFLSAFKLPSIKKTSVMADWRTVWSRVFRASVNRRRIWAESNSWKHAKFSIHHIDIFLLFKIWKVSCTYLIYTPSSPV